MSFLEIARKIDAWWLQGPVVDSISAMLDDFAARAKLALITRFPNHAVDDAALAAIGRDRKIVRGINEPAQSYAARLIRYLDDHKRRGNPFAMLEQVRAYLQAPCVVRTVDRRGNWYSIDADGNHSTNIDTGNWEWDEKPETPERGRFWLIVYPVDGTTPWAPAGARLDDVGLWTTGTASQRTFDTTATQDQVSALKSIVREWKPAGTRCEWIIVAFDAASFDPTGSTDPAAAWADWGDGAGHPVRLSTASYWAVGATKGAST